MQVPILQWDSGQGDWWVCLREKDPEAPSEFSCYGGYGGWMQASGPQKSICPF